MATTVMGLGTLCTARSEAREASSCLSSVKYIENLGSITVIAGIPWKATRILRKCVTGCPAASRGIHSSTIRCVSVPDISLRTEVSDLPLKEIPGTYGISFLGIGAIKDRLDFHWFQGVPSFYEARKEKYKSSVYRTNVPPGPPFFPDPRVIVVLDEKSYKSLFDVSLVEKKNVLMGTWTPTLELTGGYRVLSYLDPSEPKHAPLKEFIFEITKLSAPRIFPCFAASMSEVFTSWEAALNKDGKVDYMNDLGPGSFRFILKAFTNRDPYEEGENSLGESGYTGTQYWLLAHLAPIAGIPVPWYLVPLIEIFLHTLPVPFFLVKDAYTKLVNFHRTYGKELLDFAENELGLDREEALHNLLFATIFNAWAGLKLFFPSCMSRLGGMSAEDQKELAAEVRKAIEDSGGNLSMKALAAMPLVESVVYEVLRIDPPVPYQYGTAKKNFVLQTDGAAFQIKKGEVLHGYMQVATRDPKVFKDPETFLPRRFLGEEGSALLKYVLWSNGPQTEEPSVQNKHCAGKNLVLTIARLFVATIFAKYETIVVDPTNIALLTSLK